MADTGYSPATARSLAIGASDAGWDVAADGNLDDLAGLFNIASLASRVDTYAIQNRRQNADLRARARAAAGGSTTTKRFLFCGDSIMRGFGSADWTGWRGWLADVLDQRDIIVAATLSGDAGYTLSMLQPLLADALTAAIPDIVVVAIGTNDAWKPGEMTNWQARYQTYLQQILAFSSTVNVVVVRVAQSAPFTGYQTNQALIGGYQDAVVAALASPRVVEVDAGAALPTNNVQSAPYSLTDDGIHPTGALYAWLADQIVAGMDSKGWLP